MYNSIVEKKRSVLSLSVLIVVAALFPFAAHSAESRPSAAGTFYVLIDNRTDGAVLAVNRMGKGDTLVLGKVIAPVSTINANSFTASGWGKTGTVTATAVNAIHVKTGRNEETGFGKVFSLLPKEFINFDATNYKSYYNKDASLYTDIKAGLELFGGGFAPKVGDPVFISPSPESAIERLGSFPESDATILSALYYVPLVQDRTFFPLPEGYVPAPGDLITIEIAPAPESDIQWIEFDNKFGGFITEKRLGIEEPEVIGQVYQPVFGVGRFEGTLYCGPGRIRANHPGVIDISTSPMGEIGGIQIIPLEHAMSPEMKLARIITQWMVVGPVDPRESPKWEGLGPLFNQELYPSYIPLEDDRFSASSTFLDRFLVVAKLKGKEGWQLMPVVSGRNDEALLELEALRILFPIS